MAGLSGRDVVRVMMGFGCNVPAVISTRSCSSCSRGPAISAMAFGSACSYQLPATLAVLSATASVGLLDAASRILGPVMRVFDLTSQAALAVVLASVRKDGIFLLAADDGLSFPMTAPQALTAVYLAGVLLPCVVTALTIARETGWNSTAKLLAQQAGFATVFALILAWGGRWLF